MQCPDQKPNGLRQPGLLPFLARGRCYLGIPGLNLDISNQSRRLEE
jgi:hypothetical protein